MLISSNTTYPHMGDVPCIKDMEVQTPDIVPVYKAVVG